MHLTRGSVWYARNTSCEHESQNHLGTEYAVHSPFV